MRALWKYTNTLIFLILTGHLDSRSSINHVLLVTSLFSLIFSISQAALEILLHDEVFRVSASHVGSTDGYDLLLFGHGGAVFWFVSSIIFSLVIVARLILVSTRYYVLLGLFSSLLRSSVWFSQFQWVGSKFVCNYPLSRLVPEEMHSLL